MLPPLDQIKLRIEGAVPQARLEIIPNEPVPGQASLLLGKEAALEVARFLRDDPELRLDHASNVTGVYWLDSLTK